MTGRPGATNTKAALTSNLEQARRPAMADTTVPTWPDGRPLKGQSLRSYLKFVARLEELRATLVEPHWRGSAVRHPVRCIEGHNCTPLPDSVIQGIGICRVCAGVDSAAAEAKFRARVAELGGTLMGEYVNDRTAVLVRCTRGHLCEPVPDKVRRGRGLCRVCAKQDPATAEAAFRARVEGLGGTVLGSYVNDYMPVAARCAAGHACSPIPGSVKQGRGICLICVGMDSATAEAKFRARVTELGGTVIGDYVNADTPVSIRCPDGHLCAPRPGDVNGGQGICGPCKGKVSDVFYLVTGLGALKFGVTSGSPRKRLRFHRRYGYDTVVRVFEGLGGTTARDLERDLIALLKAAGVPPVRGREYYPIEALQTILHVVDDRLG